MQISHLAAWVAGLELPSVAPLLTTLGETLDPCIWIGLGHLILGRPSDPLARRGRRLEDARLGIQHGLVELFAWHTER